MDNHITTYKCIETTSLYTLSLHDITSQIYPLKTIFLVGSCLDSSSGVYFPLKSFQLFNNVDLFALVTFFLMN